MPLTRDTRRKALKAFYIRYWVLAGLFALSTTGWAMAQEYVRYSAPPTMSYEELVALAEDELPPELEAKVQKLVTTPFVSNEAYLDGSRPHRPVVEALGPVLRVVLWNIERGLELDEIKLMLTDKNTFLTRFLKDRANQVPDSESEEEKKLKEVNREWVMDGIDTLQGADIFILNEVDWGLKRTDYRAVVRELAEALKMNWAFGVEFLEIDPAVTGTETFENVEDEEERRQLKEAIAVDPSRLLAMHGTAVLSRYPIREARLEPLETETYDWFEDEKTLGGLEKQKRKMAITMGLESLLRQMRRGGRTTLTVTLDVPDLEDGQLTVVAAHLENKTAPKKRRQQMQEILKSVGHIEHPVIIAGDLNTTGTDSDVTTVKKLIFSKYGKAEFWVGTGIKYATGVGLIYDALKFGFQTARFQSDPTAKGVKWVAPNKEAALFDRIEDFRFDDGKAFDFRGDERRTINGRDGTLANSNERAGKGFETTFALARTAGPLGKFKLDWVFVKAFLEDPKDRSGSYRFAPHLARTMNDINFALSNQLSDHAPMSIDLPFEEPGELPPPRWADAPAPPEAPESWDYRTYKCGGFSSGEDPTEGERVVWTHGYFSALRRDKFDLKVTSARVSDFRGTLMESCSASPEDIFVETVAAVAAASSQDRPVDPAEVEAHWDMQNLTGGQMIDGLQDVDQNLDVVLLWLHGFFTALNPSTLERVVEESSTLQFAEQLVEAAGSQPERPVLDVVRELQLQ